MKISRFMKYTLAALAILAISVTTMGCMPLFIPGLASISLAAETETRQYANTAFSRIEIGGAFQVEVRQSADYSVSITLNKNLFDRLKVTQTGDTLQIGMEGFFPLFDNATMDAVITLPDLQGLELSGATQGKLSGFTSTQDLALAVSGVSTLNVTAVTAGDSRLEVSGASELTGNLAMASGIFNISGASTVELTGSALDTNLEVSGASTLSLTGFPMRQTAAHISGASSAEIEVSEKLDVFLSGASRLTYAGNPSLGSLSVTGGSTLNHK